MGRLITVAEAADKTTLAPGTFYSWRHKQRGDVPTGFKLAGRLVFDEDEIDAWIAAQQQATSRGGES